jgi:coenzyme F420-0:L-glutamate ligase / coenzyme F420-1:gamma-L-glutamate ligase
MPDNPKYASLLKLVRTRRSVRRFEARPVPQEAIEAVVEAARWAPSNENRQGWKFLVFEGRELIGSLARQVQAELEVVCAVADDTVARHVAQLAEATGRLADAPCLILVLHKRPSIAAIRLLGDAPHAALVSGEPLSAAMAVQNLLLAAHALGLGACVLTAPLAGGALVRVIPDLPAGFEPTCLVALGYPAENPPTPHKKAIEHILEYRR